MHPIRPVCARRPLARKLVRRLGVAVLAWAAAAGAARTGELAGPPTRASTRASTPLSTQASVHAITRASALDDIRVRGRIRVGTTGDYRPFSYLNPSTGEHEGLDIELARRLADDLGVEVDLVETSWPTLVEGMLAGRYDIAMSGITRTLDRLELVGLTDAYVSIGKVPLIRSSDRSRFRSLADIDRPGVRVGVNPGGTNEAFVRARLRHAEVVVIPRNLDIPDAIVAGRVDAMITDDVEAVLVASERPALHAVAPDEPLTRETVGFMVRRDDQAFLNWLDLWLEGLRATGALDDLERRWLRR